MNDHRLTRFLVGSLAIGCLVYGVGFAATTLWPMGLGDANWEVAAFGEMALLGAIPLIGGALLGGWGGSAGRGKVVVGSAVFCALAAVVYGLGVVVLALDIPLVIAATAGTGTTGMQLRILVAKIGLLSALYTSVFLSLTVTFSRAFLFLRRS